MGLRAAVSHACKEREGWGTRRSQVTNRFRLLYYNQLHQFDKKSGQCNRGYELN